MEGNTVESVEEPMITTNTITGEELIQRIYQGQSSPQDSRFLPESNGGVFKYFRLTDLTGLAGFEGKHYSILEVDGVTVGMSELEKDPYDEGNLWLKMVSIDPKYQGSGYSTQLVEEVFRFAQEGGFSLGVSTYNKEGDKKLRRKIRDLAEKYSVKITENN